MDWDVTIRARLARAPVTGNPVVGRRIFVNALKRFLTLGWVGDICFFLVSEDWQTLALREIPSSDFNPDTFLFIVGAQKAGTTWLYRNLRQTQFVHFRENETHYWDVVRQPFSDWDRQGRAGSTAKTNLMKRILRLAGKSATEIAEYVESRRYQGKYSGHPYHHEAYKSYLAKGHRGQPVICDSTPSYALCSQRTFAEMNGMHPSTKFIFIMRDPVHRMWSGVRHRFRYRLRAADDEGYVARAFLEALEDPFHPDRRRSDYAATLRNLYGAVPRDRVLCLFFESLFSQATMDRICEFIGIPKAPIDRGVVNEGVTPTIGLDEQLHREALDVFAETYDYCFREFGERVPDAWNAPGTSGRR